MFGTKQATQGDTFNISFTVKNFLPWSSFLNDGSLWDLISIIWPSVEAPQEVNKSIRPFTHPENLLFLT